MQLDNVVSPDGRPWLMFGFGWESRALTDIRELPEGADVTVPNVETMTSTELQAFIDRYTPKSTSPRQAAADAMYDLRADGELQARLASAGVREVFISVAFVDKGWEPPFVSPRYKYKRARQYLDVDAWFHGEETPGQEDPERFRVWLCERSRGLLEGWLRTRASSNRR